MVFQAVETWCAKIEIRDSMVNLGNASHLVPCMLKLTPL